MNKDTWEEFQNLTNTGLELSKENNIKFNAGSESTKHLASKAITGKICLDAGYRVNSEVTVPNGQIDIVAYGHPKRLSYAIELESDPTVEVKQEKLHHYVRETGLDDMILIDIGTLSSDMYELKNQLQDAIGF